MPTIITHSVVASCAASGFRPLKGFLKFLVLSLVCSSIPDADVIGYRWLHVPYRSFFGHRGFFHSPFFAVLFGILMVTVFYREISSFSKQWWKFGLYFTLLTASHGILDALTNGGYGIALLSPFTNERFFFPWTPIQVSPIGVKAFLTRRGLAVLKSEFLWVWLPFFPLVLVLAVAKRFRKRPRLPA